MLEQPKKTLAVLLAVCFLMSVTATAVGAASLQKWTGNDNATDHNGGNNHGDNGNHAKPGDHPEQVGDPVFFVVCRDDKTAGYAGHGEVRSCARPCGRAVAYRNEPPVHRHVHDDWYSMGWNPP